jgi:hypothetical protein
MTYSKDTKVFHRQPRHLTMQHRDVLMPEMLPIELATFTLLLDQYGQGHSNHAHQNDNKEVLSQSCVLPLIVK